MMKTRSTAVWTLVTALLLTGLLFTAALENQEKEKEKQASCHGAYDLYFVLDKSGSVMRDPRTRVSFIVFSSQHQVILPLTSSRLEIQAGLERLRAVVPAGETYMHVGLAAASAQISAEAQRSASIVLALTDGELTPYILELSVKEANKARSLGARVYCVGIKDFKEQQLAEVADTKDQVFPVKDGFHTLRGIVNSILEESCTEILSVAPSSVCVNETFELVLRGRGFPSGRGDQGVVCSFVVDQQTVRKK
ncbi:hypothetical protein NHX12_034443 [Muraenolepis orangiensis]|uniref:VWFA domain-containing protein n=1 Tax=Muraenolepis orangiensis TaxID=630683 RepID=A0A9Q0D775_9TELE|nr:hypothetical protein NHX12_034443 [Muraenolepis orangiensis]